MFAADAEKWNEPQIEEDDSDPEYALLPLLRWSDTTQLLAFGAVSFWPIYLYFGNLSKYIRGLPTEFMAQHLAYIPQLSISHLACTFRSPHPLHADT